MNYYEQKIEDLKVKELKEFRMDIIRLVILIAAFYILNSLLNEVIPVTGMMISCVIIMLMIYSSLRSMRYQWGEFSILKKALSIIDRNKNKILKCISEPKTELIPGNLGGCIQYMLLLAKENYSCYFILALRELYTGKEGMTEEHAENLVEITAISMDIHDSVRQAFAAAEWMHKESQATGKMYTLVHQTFENNEGKGKKSSDADH